MDKNKDQEIRALFGSSKNEMEKRRRFFEYFKNSPLPSDEILYNLGLYINRQSLSRILFMNELYKKIIDVHGVVMEFGVRWGQNLALWQSFRGMYEPYNYNRKIIGFDTFEGFPELSKKDGDTVQKGDFSVSKDYVNYLEKVLDYHESESPIPHKKKYKLVIGDASETIHSYLEDNPETIVALAYFDFDLYTPTKNCLEAIQKHLTKGTVLAFDELNTHEFQGETIALKEVLGLDKYAIKRSILNPLISYLVID